MASRWLATNEQGHILVDACRCLCGGNVLCREAGGALESLTSSILRVALPEGNSIWLGLTLEEGSGWG